IAAEGIATPRFTAGKPGDSAFVRDALVWTNARIVEFSYNDPSCIFLRDSNSAGRGRVKDGQSYTVCRSDRLTLRKSAYLLRAGRQIIQDFGSLTVKTVGRA